MSRGQSLSSQLRASAEATHQLAQLVPLRHLRYRLVLVAEFGGVDERSLHVWAPLLDELFLDVLLLNVLEILGLPGRRHRVDERGNVRLDAGRILPLTQAELLESVLENNLVHGVQVGARLPDLKLAEQGLPVVGVDRLAALELEPDRDLKLLELGERLAREEVRDLGLDVRVDPIDLGHAQLAQAGLADSLHGL
jgi:hypothetical protein